MPVDVLILNPNLNAACCVKDTLLYELQFTEALPINAIRSRVRIFRWERPRTMRSVNWTG